MKLRTEMGHFWIMFENGYTLSVFNGYGSHTENNFAFKKWNEIVKLHQIYEGWESELVEIAILNQEGDLITQDIIKSDDSVKTVNINELVELINVVNNLETKGE